MMIPPVSQPSNPKNKISMKEITVQDAIDFAGVEPSHEEELTTEFFRRVSGDDALLFTAEDRRYLLFWYWLNTAKDIDIPVTYQCPHCNQEHVYLLDGRDLAAEYSEIAGEAERTIDGGVKVIPMSGAGAEACEKLRFILDTLEVDTPEYRKQEANNSVAQITWSIIFPDEDRTLPAEERFKLRFERIRAMSATEFAELSAKVEAAVDEMAHGLRTIIENGRVDLETPPHACPVAKEGTTRIRVPFRPDHYIPRL